MDVAELRPLRIGEILDVAIKIYRSNFATLVKAVALVVAPVQVLVAMVQASVPDSPFVTFPDPETTASPEIDAGDLWAGVAAFFVVAVLGTVAAQLALAASLKAVSGAYMGEGEPQWRESLRFALSRLGPLVWLALLTNVLLFLAALACLVPGIYLYGAWAVAVPVLLLEDVRGRGALKRSRQLVRDRWWPTFGAVFLGALLVFVLQSAFGFLLLGSIFVPGGDNEVVQFVLQVVVGTASGVLATPFSAALAAVVYFDLRVRKEGLDLELLARRVGIPPPADGRPAVMPPRPPSPVWPPPAPGLAPQPQPQPQSGWPPPPPPWPGPPAPPPPGTPHG